MHKTLRGSSIPKNKILETMQTPTVGNEDSEYMTEFRAGAQNREEHLQTLIGDLSLEYSVKWKKKGRDQCV